MKTNPKQYIKEHKVLSLLVIGILVLLLASPVLQRILVFPQSEFYTELWLLGPQRRAENYPFNVTRSEDYGVFVGIGNHLGHSASYMVEVKFRNDTQPAADSFHFTPSNLPSLYSIKTVVQDNGTWELPVNFSFDYTYDVNLSRVNFTQIVFNSATLDVKEYSAAWDAQNRGFFGNLFFELWIYNSTTRNFQYHERFVSLRLNMTVESLG